MNEIGATAPDERELMRSLHEGSVAALGAIHERTASYLYPLALRIVGSRERACVVLEDLFEEIWRDRTRWRGASAIPAVEWIARCRELALAQAGPESRRPMMEPPPMPTAADLTEASLHAAPLPPAAARASAASGAATGARSSAGTGPASRHADERAVADPRAVAREAFASLPETDRRALEEVYFRGASAREVAVVIGAATSDAAMLLRSALVRFREHAAERETTPAEAGSAS